MVCNLKVIKDANPPCCINKTLFSQPYYFQYSVILNSIFGMYFMDVEIILCGHNMKKQSTKAVMYIDYKL